MKKILNKVKIGLSAFWVTIISFFSKVFGQFPGDHEMVEMYGTPYSIDLDPLEQPTLIDIITKITKRPLIGITLIIWIANYLKIKRIKDKTQKKKKIIKSIITIIILLLIITVSIRKTWIKNPLKHNTIVWLEWKINIINWIFIWITLLIGILYLLIRTKKIKDKTQKRKEIISTIILVILIVTYLVLAR